MSKQSTASKHEAVILENEYLASGMNRLLISCPELSRTIAPGQFFNIRVPGDPSQILRLPFSWSWNDAAAGTVETAYLIVGDGTRRLAGLASGTVTDLLGPCGHGWTVPEDARRALVVAGGSGVVPLLPLARVLGMVGVSCDFVQGAPTEARVVFEDALEHYGANLHVSTDDGTRGYHGFSTAVAEKLLAQNSYDVVYTCGPQPMMRRVAEMAKSAGVPCQVSLERLMACGFGACTTCLVNTVDGPKTACVDGPVFDAAEVVW